MSGNLYGVALDPAPIWLSPRFAGETAVASFDIGTVLAIDPQDVRVLTASVAPSGTGELTIAALSMSGNNVQLALILGQSTRIYTILLSVTLQDGSILQLLLRQKTASMLIDDQAPAPPSAGFGSVTTWNYVPMVVQTIVTLTAGVDRILLAANPLRKKATLVTLPGGDVTLNFGAPAVVGQGWPLPAPTAEQKAAEPFETVSQQDIHGISPSNATVVVLEGT